MKWSDGGDDEREFSWKIISSSVPEDQEPQATNFVYNGEEQCGVIPSSSGFYTLIDARQTAAGNYTATARLNNPSGYSNCTWHDGTTADRTINFTIDKLTVKRPTAISGLYYTGSPQNGIQDSADAAFYDLGGDTAATDTGSYTATATIGAAHHGNCEWASGDPAASGDTIEISWRIGGQPVPRPTAKTGLVYNGGDLVGIETHGSENLYTLGGVTNATDAGSYIAKATLKDTANYLWEGGDVGQAEIQVQWTIARLPVEPVSFGATTNFVYDTNSHFVVVAPAGWPSYCSINSGVTNAIDVGVYPVRFALNGNNYIWNTATPTIAPRVLEWRISKSPVAPPTVVSNLVYNGGMQYGVVHSADKGLYHQSSGQSGGRDAKAYQATFVLNDPANNCWTSGDSDSLTLNWSIAQAPNSITVLKLPSWKAEEVPVEHRVTVDADWKGDGEPKIDYSTAETGPWTENQPTNVGVYFVRATVAETANWAAAERTAKFSIWSDPDRIFRDYVDLRVQGYRGSEPLTNFPLLVRISESRLRGFYYSRAGRTGEDMVFMDTASDAQLPYEVDTWNVTGESLVWVRVSVLTNGAPIRMYWTLREGADAPGYSPEEVWSDYVGVWHFADQGVEPSSDATGNGNLGYPDSSNPTESISVMTHTAANIGQGRIIGLNGGGLGGCRLVVSNTPSFHFDGKLTISGWLKMNTAPSGGPTATAGRVWPFSRRNVESAADTDFGAYFVRSQSADSNLRGMKLFGSGSSSANANQIWSATILDKWSYFGAAYNGGAARVCGAQMGNVSFAERNIAVMPPVDSGENLAFGNIPGTNNTYYSFAGVVDEYRLTPLVRSGSWMQAEFDTVNDSAFCTNSLVVKDGLKVNYWLDYPAFAPLAMEAGEHPSVCYNGRLAEGWASTNYVNVYDSTTNSVYPTAGGSYRVIFALDESFTGYELLEAERGLFNLTLNGKSPYTDIAGNLGDTGRILLMNRHREGTQEIVRYQGYYFNDMCADAMSRNPPTFWQILAVEPLDSIGAGQTPYLRSATESILWTRGYGAKLWHLINCRHGNTMNAAFLSGQNYLSWSEYSYATGWGEERPTWAPPSWDDPGWRESSLVREAGISEVGQIVMRNIGGENAEDAATVYSSCFTNGIGTIYFDAVNGWNNNIGNNYGICVEICTNVAGDATALLPPTDENITGVTIETNDVGGVEVVTTNYNYYANAVWRRVPFVAYKRDNTPDFVREEVPSNGINLAIAHGGTTTNFYRMAVPLDLRIPARFRIRRTSTAPAPASIDSAAFILLDNILVSYPVMSADLKPLGFYDPDRRGKQVLGQEIAFATPFPAQTDVNVFGRAAPYYYVNPGTTAADTNKFVVAANLHYRWRYLRQRAEPTAQIAELNPAYPGYYGDSLWRTVPLNPRDGFRSIEPLVLPAAAGDVEFWYDLTMDTPYYEYVDYSGLDYGVPYDERQTAVTNHMTAAEMEADDGRRMVMPTTGADWFVRLREGKSDFEGVQVVVTGALAGEYEMDPIDDNMWRALVKVPLYTSGQISFRFRGRNRQQPGATEFAENAVYFGPSVDESTAMPGSGKLEMFEEPTSAKYISASFDTNCTGYLEFKLSDRFLTWALSRAEYQNFNNWSDAHTVGDKFCVASGTNGVDDVAMTTYNVDMSYWRLFNPDKSDLWTEPFHVTGDTEADRKKSFPKEQYFQDHITPNSWDGHNITFVSKTMGRSGDYYANDNYAGKISGQGEGYIAYPSSFGYPEGLEKINVSARIGQSISFDNMCYSTPSLMNVGIGPSGGVSWSMNQDYVFFAPMLMSQTIPGNQYVSVGDMAPGAAVSVVAYYWPGIGCYEFRLSRQTNNDSNNGPRYVLELIRWSNKNGKISPTTLGTQVSNSRIWYNETGNPGATPTATNNKINPYCWGLFISVKTTSAGTLVVGGASAGGVSNLWGYRLPVTPGGEIPVGWNGDTVYHGIAYLDNDPSRPVYGGYGVAAKECPVRIVGMHHYPAPVPDNAILFSDNNRKWPNAGSVKYYVDRQGSTNNKFTLSPSNAVPEYADIPDRWAVQNSLQLQDSSDFGGYSATAEFRQAYRGFRMPTSLSQSVEIVLRNADVKDAPWTNYINRVVSGYVKKDLVFPLYLTGRWDMRVSTGANNVDVVVENISQSCWEAPDIEDIDLRNNGFAYTQGIVQEAAVGGRHELLLQPSRGSPTKAMSLRSPQLDGLGKISFDYKGVNANAEIWVQIATNEVYDNMHELNTTVREGPDCWITVAKYAATSKTGYDGILSVGPGGTGSRTCYVGLHDRADQPVLGLFRLFVPTNVIVAARQSAIRDENVNYGDITIIDATVTDEPRLSERSWRGWNMRTVGDATDSESRMYLSDTTIPGEAGNGLSGALNNTVAANTIDDDPLRAKVEFPTIFSPTFHIPEGTGRQTGIGSIDFRARLYTTGASTRPGKIWLYGAKSSVDGPWTLLGEYAVDSPVMKTFTWSTGNENYRAAKFAISDPSAKEENNPAYERIVFDEITIREKVQPSVGFLYARPFRNHLFDPVEITDILSPSEQPLVGESWGVQAKVLLRQLADEIDVEKGFRVTLSYFLGDTPWGYQQWQGEPEAVHGIELIPVGDPTNLVFRSVGTSEETLVPPAEDGGIVQYQLTVRYQDRGGGAYVQRLETYSDWPNPTWYYPVDKNVEAGGDKESRLFSPYTILDTVSPGRAWINEFNYNDGTSAFNGGTKPTDNQFIELCIPSGVNMDGWRLRLTDLDRKTWVMAKLGYNGLPSSKVSPNSTNNFEFFLLESPVTDMAGGINRHNPDAPQADGTWNNDGSIAGASNGTLNNEEPYQLELIRPNGIIEHQIVFQGTNRYPVSWGYTADALARELARREDPVSPKRMVIGGEVERAVTNPTALGSSGVVGGEDSGEPAPGDAETWRSGLQFTPGWLNEGQIIPENWYTAPNGVFSWVYFVNNGPHIVQTVGTNTAPYVAAVVLRDSTTNVVYDVAKWYAMNLKENNVEVGSGIRGHYTHSVTPTSTTLRVVASEVVNPDLTQNYGIDIGNPYSDSVFNWLTRNWPDSDADDIRLARFRGLNDTSTNLTLSLTEMYWLDIPPVPESEAERNSPDHGSNWWLRAGITKSPTEHKIYRDRGGREVCYTNHVVDMQMYITNTVTGVVDAPRRLQGLDNAQSDSWSGTWTSETFKVRAKLNLSWLDKSSDFLPFRFFIFNANSFTGPEGGQSANVPEMGQIGPYSARIEVLDPHSTESIGANYGWENYPNTSGFYLWSIDTEEYPFGVQTLKYDDTYPTNLTTP